MGPAVPFKSGLVRDEVFPVFEERGARERARSEEESAVEAKNSSRFVSVRLGQAAEQTGASGRDQVHGEVLRVSPALASFVQDEPAAG